MCNIFESLIASQKVFGIDVDSQEQWRSIIGGEDIFNGVLIKNVH